MTQKTNEPKLYKDFDPTLGGNLCKHDGRGNITIDISAAVWMLNSHAELIHSLQNQVKKLENKLNNLTKPK